MVEDSDNRTKLLFGCLVFIVVFSLAFRYWTSGTVESGGDAVYKWSLVKQYVLFGDLPLHFNHHACRWTIGIPLFFIQKYLGTDPTVYYVWPFLTSTLSAVCGFLLLERLRTLRTGLVAGVLIILSGPLLRQGTQLLPMGTALPFLLGALYFLVRWRDDGRSWNIVASVLLLFLAYGAKITIIYYIPAFLVLICVFAGNSKARIRNSLYFLGIFIAFFVVETCLFNMATGASFGRMELIQASHPAIRVLTPTARVLNWEASSGSLLQYLSNFFVYLKYPGRAPAVLYYAAVVISMFALTKKWRNTFATAVPFLFGFFGHAYAITSVFPFNRPERMLLRYQTVIFELALLTLILFLSAPRFKGTVAKYIHPFKAGDRKIRIILFLALALPITVNAVKRIHLDTGYMKTSRSVAIVRQAREEGLPVFILGGDGEKESIQRVIKYHALYTNTRYFRRIPVNREHDIRLADFPVVVRNGEPYLLVESNGHFGELGKEGIFLDNY